MAPELTNENIKYCHQCQTSINDGAVKDKVTHLSSLLQDTAKEIYIITSDVQKINEISNINTRSVEEIASASEHLHSMIEQLNEELNKFKS